MNATTTERKAELIEAGWELLLVAIALSHIGVGVTMLLDGAAGLALPAFQKSQMVPSWLWGTWALTGGVALLLPGWAKLAGVVATAAWFGLWWVLLTLGLVQAGPPRLAIFVYGLLVFVHVLVLVVEVMPRWEEWRRARTSP